VVNNNNNNPPPARRVVLRDIAQAANVSVMTVSRALRHGEHVSLVLRRRIQTLARRLGYEPDPMLASLVSYRHAKRPRAQHSVVAYLTTDQTRSGFQKLAVTGQVFIGAEERGRELGFRVEPLWLPDLNKRGRDPTQVLLARGIRGIILARLPRVDMRIGLDWDRFSCVAIGYSLQKPAFHYVASHIFQDTCLAFDETIARGYKRPMLVMTKDADRRTFHQFHGAFLFKQQNLPPEDRLPVLWAEDEHPREELRHYINMNAPDVLIAPWPGLIKPVREIGYSPPKGMGFVDLNLESPEGSISGIFQNFARIGRAAMDRLNMQLLIGERGVPSVPEGTTIYGKWVPGRTL
jgi:DNA-binding LacI/PurR family transcriptional regulator